MIAAISKRRRKVSPIGLDVGARTIRAVQLVATASNYSVVRAYKQCCDVDEDDGTIAPSRLAENLIKCVSGVEFRGKSIHMALNMPEVEIHAIELPDGVAQSSADEIEKIVQWEVQRLTTREQDSLETRHWHLPKARPTVPNAIGVAVQTKTVNETMGLCRAAGLNCVRLDVAAAALARFGQVIASWPENCVWGMLDVGFRRTRLVVCVDDVPVLVRDVGTGSDAWTDRIAEGLQISKKSAEVHKCEAGIGLGERRMHDGDDGVPLKKLGGILAGIVKNDLRAIAGEIKRSYEYVLGCYGGRSAGKLVLVGGGAALQNLPGYLTEALGIEVQRGSKMAAAGASRLENTRIKPAQLDEYALAIGLAIGD